MKKLLTLMAFIVITLNSYAYDVCIDGIYYDLDWFNKKATVTSGDYSGNRKIPNKVKYNGEDYLVTSIGRSAFYGCSGLTSVTIPNSVTSIGRSAFYGCSGLTSVTIPNSVTSIGEYAFSHCESLASVIIPNSVTNIGKDAFYYCPGLKSVNISCKDEADFANYVQRSDISSIFHSEGLQGEKHYIYINGIEQTKLVIPNSVTYIGGYAFHSCSGLTSVTIPNSVKSIGERAFYGCKYLTSVTIPNSVTSIGGYAFRDCNGLISMTIPNSVTSIGDGAFYSCSALTSIKVPNSVTSIKYRAFSDCSSLTSVTIPNSVTSIESYAFQGCSSLKSVSISCKDEADFANYVQRSDISSIFHSKGLQGLKHYIYINGIEQTKLVIPNSVKSIGGSAFKECFGINSVTIGNSVTSVGKSAFDGCSNVNELIYADGTTTAIKTGLITMTSLTIPSSMTSIDYSFSDCPEIKSVNISCKDEADFANYVQRSSYSLFYPSGLSGIKHAIYINGEEQTSIKIPNSVTHIGAYTFKDCTSLKSVTIPNSVTKIGSYGPNDPHYESRVGDHVFSNCPNVTELIYAEGTKEVLATGLTSIISVTIPNSVTSIGHYAFFDCSNLSSVPIPNSVMSIGAYAFSGCSGLTSVTIPNFVTSIGYNAFQKCSGLTSVTIPNSVTSIKEHTFYKCSGLTSVVIGNSVTSIGGHAFYGCDGLTSVTIPNSVTFIGELTFGECNNLVSVRNFAEKPQKQNSVVHSFTKYGDLHVLKGYKTVYSKAPYWCNFNIIADLEPTSIEIPSVTNATKTKGNYYNLKGERVSNDAKGIIIKNGKKVLVK